MNTLPVATFNYNIDALLEEVTKRTSYTGMMRGTEQEPYLVDRMSLTSGEDFMFKEFLEEAVHETYDWVKAFGRNIPAYDKIALDYTDTYVYKNFGASVKDSNGVEYEFGKVHKIDCTFMPVMLTDKIQVNFSELKAYKNTTDTPVVTANIRFVVHSLLDGLLDVTETIERTDSLPTTVTIGLSRANVPFEFNENGSTHVIKNVEMYVTFSAAPVTVVDIKKNTYVEYRTDFSDDTIFELYKVNADCTNADWMNHSSKLNYDPRGCVVYMLERKEHFDENMIPSVDRALKEAIINRIIYLWFEYVNAPEAEKYLLKFEDYGHKAQLGMNTRTKDIQRKYKLF